MNNTLITDVPGFSIGHYTDTNALTGCTVVLCPPKTAASCDVRGSSPGSRELALLAPEKQMQEIHAVLITGGSAFGLGAANGVMSFLKGKGIGYVTPWTVVPIVPSAVIFDLNIGSSQIYPTSENAVLACNAASTSVEQGNVGAGTGATVGKWAGLETAMKGGVGTSSKQSGKLIVGALAVVNSVGDVVDTDGSILAGAFHDGKFLGSEGRSRYMMNERLLSRNTNTTIVVVACNASMSKTDCFRTAQRAHNGMARSIVPAHTTFDGDTVFALSSGEVQAPIDLIAELGAEVTAEAIRNAVKHARTISGIRGLAEKHF